MTGAAWNVEKMSFFGEKKFQLKFWRKKFQLKFFFFPQFYLHSKFCRNSQTALTFHDNVEQLMSLVENVLTIAVVPSQLFPTPQILNNNRSETVRNKCPNRNVPKSPNQVLDKLISCFTSLNETRSNHTNNVKIINRTKTMFRCSQNQIVIWKSECESDAW